MFSIRPRSEGGRGARCAVLAVMGILLSPLASAADAVTHCRAGEQPLFSCSTGKKTVSPCGAPASGAPKAPTIVNEDTDNDADKVFAFPGAN